MNNKFFGSLALASAMAVSVSAVDVSSFGHIGTGYASQLYGAAAGRVGVEIGLGSLSLGLGTAGAFPYAIRGDHDQRSYVKRHMFDTPNGKQWFNWISDLYFRVDTVHFSLIAGRHDTTAFFRGEDGKAHTGVDWFSGQNEGVSFKVDSRYFAWWGIYSYETMDFGGRTPGRLGSDLMGFDQYHKTGNYLSTGFDINVKDMFYVDPFVNYSISDKYLQAGLKLQLNLGKGTFKSKTILRGMYQNAKSGSDTTLLWADQEFLVSNLFKFGVGGYHVGGGNNIFASLGENTRFYANTFGYLNQYFTAGTSAWYAFMGLEHKYFLLDLLYGWGRGTYAYREISAIGQVNVYSSKKVLLGVGGGWVKAGAREQGVAFVKLSF